MQRPHDLPDFENPPLSEVVLGVQFLPPQNYSQIYAKDVWDLYRKKYPSIKELDSVPPMFETFGPFSAENLVNLPDETVHDRYWFISKDEKDLIQFQPDRLLHNWRKVPSDSGKYPRFESIIEKYESELELLESFYKKTFAGSKLQYTQCEASYINLIPLTKNNSEKIENWITFISINNTEYENFSFATSKILYNNDAKPYGRCFIECRKVLIDVDQNAIELKITVRGAPETTKRESALWFLYNARNEIVRTFDSVTTVSAHNSWGKQ